MGCDVKVSPVKKTGTPPMCAKIQPFFETGKSGHQTSRQPHQKKDGWYMYTWTKRTTNCANVTNGLALRTKIKTNRQQIGTKKLIDLYEFVIDLLRFFRAQRGPIPNACADETWSKHCSCHSFFRHFLAFVAILYYFCKLVIKMYGLWKNWLKLL